MRPFLILAILAMAAAPLSRGADWVVTTNNDAGPGSLRDALQKYQSGDNILFDALVFAPGNSPAATTISVLSPLPSIDRGNVTIDAQNRRVTLNGSSAGQACGLTITSNGNVVMGLTIGGFAQSAIRISSGQNNTLGGRRNLGAGVNGQGLRLSRNGAYGIDLNNGACGNSIKGCWIGLDAGGTSAEPNLGGIIVQSQSCGNIIGGTTAAGNVIGGNNFEGITITGAGSNNNLLKGNIIGGLPGATPGSLQQRASAPTQGNGAAGILLSGGTMGNLIGGDTDLDTNIIVSNGAYGIEVHDSATQANTFLHNSIYNNRQGGIGLLDRSNAGISAPVFTAVARLAPTSLPFTSHLLISGTANGSGIVEVFNDTGTQGGTLLGRTQVTLGAWQMIADSSDRQNITALFTNAAGNTSSFSVFGAASGPPVITSPGNVSGALGVSFAYSIGATGNPTSFSASPLPAGLTLNPATGIISGTPAQLGLTQIMLTATNAAGTGSAVLSLTITGGVPAIGSPLSASANIVTPFSYTIGATNFPQTFSAAGLPAGLALDPLSGRISGTPATVGVFPVLIGATNPAGTGAATLLLSVSPYPITPDDSNGSGIPDKLKILAGADLHDLNDSPLFGGMLNVRSASVALNFAKASRDAMQLSLVLELPVDFRMKDSIVAIQFGDLIERAVLNARGNSPPGNLTLKLRVKAPAKKSAPKTALVRLKIKSAELQSGLAGFGLADATTASAGELINLPVAAAINSAGTKTVFIGDLDVLYHALKGRQGRAHRH